MNLDARMLEQIVAEVVRRLGQLAADPPAVAAPPVPAAPGPMRPVAATDTLLLDARVISTATIQGRLKGIRTICVQPSAVVTPSVRDELEKRHIRLEHQQPRENATDTGDVTVVRCVRSGEAERAADTLPLPPGAVERLSDRLPLAVACAVEAVACGRRVAVLVTDDTLPAVCMLNRSPHVRAAQVRATEDVRCAIAAIGANVLVIDPRHMKANQWNVAIAAFRTDLPRACPPGLGGGSSHEHKTAE